MNPHFVGFLIGFLIGFFVGWILSAQFRSSSNHVEKIDFIMRMNERFEELQKTRIDGDVLQGSIRILLTELDDSNFPIDVINSYVANLRDDFHKIYKERLNARDAERDP
jgi:hypothetical protein